MELLFIVVLVYMFPTLVALKRGVQDTGTVLVVNLLLGWTLLFWVIALALACRSVPERDA